MGLNFVSFESNYTFLATILTFIMQNLSEDVQRIYTLEPPSPKTPEKGGAVRHFSTLSVPAPSQFPLPQRRHPQPPAEFPERDGHISV